MSPVARPAAPARRKRKLSFKETQELAVLPDQIDALEQERIRLFATLTDPAATKSGGAAKATARLKALEVDLATATARWETLELIQTDG